MKKCRLPLVVAVFLVISAGISIGQETFVNSTKPVAANAGRVITPTEVLIIEDSGEKYYFKYPNALKTGPDGSIFVIDENQFLQFDKAGKFLRNLFKKGQGPGEMTRMQNFAFFEGAAIAFSDYPPKLVWFDGAGKSFKNASLNPKYRFLRFHGRIGRRWVFETYDFPAHSGDPAYIEHSDQLLAWDEPVNDWMPLSAFPVQIYVVSPGAFFDVGNFLAVPFGDRYLAISHTPDYLIKIFDVDTNRVVHSFRRNYERVPPPPLKPGQHPPTISVNGKSFMAPESKYANDVSNILVRGDRLWVITSTVDKKKGVVVDIFDGEGIYRDSFYLNLPEPALNAIRFPLKSALTEDALLMIEWNDEGTFAIKKYKIEE